MILHRFGTFFTLQLDKNKNPIDIFGLSTGDGYTILFRMQFILVFFNDAIILWKNTTKKYFILT